MRSPFRLTCAACERTVAAGADVHLVDEEWRRRHARPMAGRLVCVRCSFDCNEPCVGADGEYVPGHQHVRYPPGIEVPESTAAGLRNRTDFDSWSHLLTSGTQKAMVIRDPVSGIIQGAAEYLQGVADNPRKLDPDLHGAVVAALWDAS